MAKKFVRGITDIKTINNQDFDTNNVNDLLSDGQYNYIHRKKGKNEEYHNLTDNIKTISSDNTELLSVTNNNKTTNTANLHPKHDAQKEQVLESQNNTITINHGTNGTDEKTTVNTNPQKVLEHENLISNSQYVTIEHEEDSNTSEIKTDKLNNTINELNSKIATVGGRNYLRGTSDKYKTHTSTNYVLGYESAGDSWDDVLKPLRAKTVTIRAYIKNDTDYPVNIQVWSDAGEVSGNTVAPHSEGWSVGTGEMPANWTTANVAFVQSDSAATGGTIQAKKAKLEIGNIPSDWSPAPEDIYPLLAQKQDVLTAGDGISITGDSISLKTIDEYLEDLNNLTYTCTAKPIDNAPNLPTGVGGNGVLSVIRVGNVVSQTYHALDNNVYYRITNNSSSTFVWTPWVKLTTTAV